MSRSRAPVKWALFAVGVALRACYVLRLHPAADYLFSDMHHYADWAERIFQPHGQTIADTFHPPGTPLYFGVLHLLDPSWQLAYLVQVIVSSASLLLIFGLARRLYGEHTALLALALAAVYFPFIHYAAYFLSENPFTCCVLASLYAFVRAWQSTESAPGIAWAVTAGAAAGLAASFKNAIMVPMAVLGIGAAICAVRKHHRSFAKLAAASLLGLSLFVIPMAVRCTELNEGHFCPMATNTALNILMGHYGHTGTFYWYDRANEVEYQSTTPTSELHGYTTPARFLFAPWDSHANWSAARGWIATHPAEALTQSLQSVVDLFTMPTIWPAAVFAGIDLGAYSQRFFWMLILVPALAQLARRRRGLLRARAERELFLLLPVLGVMLAVFVSVAEVRYRVPFDGFLIILAARAGMSAAALLKRTRRRQQLATA